MTQFQVALISLESYFNGNNQDLEFACGIFTTFVSESLHAATSFHFISSLYSSLCNLVDSHERESLFDMPK